MSSPVFVDASVIAAILLNEADAEVLEDRIVDSSKRLTSAVAVFEATLAISNRKVQPIVVAQTAVMDYVLTFRMKIIEIDAEIGRLALDARSRYGKGTGHPARLNMGDCFAYACAKAHGVALLYKGDDFVHTDLA
ncbi:MAG: VapC toxin family PIN domain ribonuclease [Ancylobacter novellus]|uniref:Ribonuclease VapC n=1 Tax=Ancylobacter novellus TaxID=921 RepID=A0A2W5KK33_ANCNO|nr:MAG: VapC toxin family PIN domain ribonuclease [Ancylobacter novellus]